ANTFLKAQGRPVGRSLVEDDRLAVARTFLRKAVEKRVEVALPVDAIVSDSIDSDAGDVIALDQIGDDQRIFDIGPETARRYAERIGAARTVFWNGPMGVFERPPFSSGTMS